MSTSQHRRWSAEEKLRILQEASRADQTMSAVCRHYPIASGQFPGLSARTGYAWEKQARQGRSKRCATANQGAGEPIPASGYRPRSNGCEPW